MSLLEAYLEGHNLLVSPASLNLAYEQLENELELTPYPDENDPEVQQALADHEAKRQSSKLQVALEY